MKQKLFLSSISISEKNWNFQNYFNKQKKRENIET